MLDIRRIDAAIAVAPQIAVTDLPEIARRGYVLILNNRPDGEAPDEPQGAEIEAAARAAGLDYRYLPIGHGGFLPDQIKAMGDLLQDTDGAILAYCRSGTRSCFLWALGAANAGIEDAGEVKAKAGAAGYDVAPIMPIVDHLASGAA